MTQSVALRPPGLASRRGRRRASTASSVPALLLLPAAAALGVLAAGAPLPALAVLLSVALSAAVVVKPPLAAYLWLGVTPLVVGIDRGSLLPVLRPNEALLVLLAVLLGARWCVLAVGGRVTRPRPTWVDAAFALLLVTGSVLPLLWMLARGRPLSAADLQAAAVVGKYYALFVLFRLAITTEAQTRRCLWASLAAGAVVSVLAVLQSLSLLGVHELLSTYWAPSGAGLATGRGSSTIGNAHGAGDLLVFNLAIALALLLGRRRGRTRLLLGDRPALERRAALLLVPVFFVGALGSGQVSGVIALVVGILAVGHVLRQLPRVALGALFAAPPAMLALWPVVERRLAAVEATTGLPSSWTARLDNLSTYFWPRLFDGYDWLLGVQPVAEAAGRESYQTVIHIESGHTWFLWIGGVPYLLGFFAFVYVAVRTARAAVLRAHGAFAVAGAATFAAYCAVFMLTTFDPHLFLRGSADLAIPLLALTASGVARAAAPPDEHTTAVLLPRPARDTASPGPATTHAPELPMPSRRGEQGPEQVPPHVSPGAIPPPRSPQSVGRSRVLVGVVLLALVGGAALWALDGPPPGPVARVAAPFDRVLVLAGSSLAARDAAPAEAAVRTLGGQGEIEIAAGAGYARKAPDGGPPLAVAVREVPGLASFDAIVVQGGEADVGAPAAEVYTATIHLIDFVQAKAPAARLTLVGPVPRQLSAAPELVAVSDSLRRAAAARDDVVYLDPQVPGWRSDDPLLGRLLGDALRPQDHDPFARRTLVLSGSSLSTPGVVPAASRTAYELGAIGAIRVIPRAGYARSITPQGVPLVVALREQHGLADLDHLVVQGGEADNVASDAELANASLHLIDYARAKAPSASLTLVGPIPAALPAPASLVRVNDTLRAAAASRGVAFVDALSRGWTDTDVDLGQRLAQAVREQP